MIAEKKTITLNSDSLDKWYSKNLEHLRYDYPLLVSDTVIDVGAFQGEFSEEIYKRYRCNIVAVEPSEYIGGLLNAVIINKAAGTHDGLLQFGGRSYYASVFEPPDHEYPCFDINELLKQYERIALLKINIEGAEYDLLNHIINHGCHQRVKNIQVQFHQVAGVPYERWYSEISNKLSLTHELTWYYPFCWENWRLKDA